MTTFTVSGFWHGAAWQYVAWGSLNGAGLTPQVLRARTGDKLRPSNVPGGERLVPPIGVAAKIIATFLLVCVTWVFFRSSSIQAAIEILGKIITAPFSTGDAAGWPARTETIKMLFVVGVLVAAEWLQRRHAHPLTITRWPRAVRWAVYTALLWTAFTLSPDQTSPFIYFQF